jgi:hypothetical protein
MRKEAALWCFGGTNTKISFRILEKNAIYIFLFAYKTKISYQYKTTDNTIISYILILMNFDARQEYVNKTRQKTLCTRSTFYQHWKKEWIFFLREVVPLLLIISVNIIFVIK